MIIVFLILYLAGAIALHFWFKKNVRNNNPIEEWLDVIFLLFIDSLSWAGLIIFIIFEQIEKIKWPKPPKWL